MRNLPKFYSWVDHRLIHDGHLRKLSSDAATLYLFLLTVGDRFGMSYYSDRAVCKRINIGDIYSVREELIAADLIAYAKPVYQLLSLPKKMNRQIVKSENLSTEKPATEAEVSALFNQFHGGLR